MKKVQMLGKRIFDLVFSMILLLMLSPLFFVIAILIKLDSRGPVFFKQERAGQHGIPFMIYKFRTMCDNAVNIGDGYYTGKNDARITRVGNFLRDWSLDELPQLINILIGDMSIVGPRPTLLYQIELYDEEQRKRLDMKPGVTGLAQVNGRNSLSWPERIQYDVTYVQNWSLWMDFVILIKTIKVVLLREGVYAEKENFVIKDEKELDKVGVKQSAE